MIPDKRWSSFILFEKQSWCSSLELVEAAERKVPQTAAALWKKTQQTEEQES